MKLSKQQGKKLLGWLCWIYGISVVCIWMVMFFFGDRWWPATVVLFSPRWLFALPLLILLPCALWLNRWLLLLIGIVFMVIFIPFMGFTFSTQKQPVTSESLLRVLTCNIRAGGFNPALLSNLIQESGADIVALQECPPKITFAIPKGWSIVHSRGFAVLSRFPLHGMSFVEVQPPNETWKWPCMLQTVVATPRGNIAVCTVQLPTARKGLQSVLDRHTLFRPSRKGRLEQDTMYRWRAAEAVLQHVNGLAAPVILAGDFNTPADSALFRQVWNGFANAFSERGFGYGFTQRVSVRGMPFSARIDHILTSKELAPHFCAVGPDVGSDHLPLIADFIQLN